MGKYLVIYLIIISIITFFFYAIDKKRAKIPNARRISEATLLILSILGGAFGGYIVMIYKHHKTKHWYFKYGMPTILALEIVILGWIFI